MLAHATRPEILRANLGGVVLQLKALGVGDVLEFPLLDPPPRAALLRSLELLYALGALDDSGALTPVGTSMARFPLEPMVRACFQCVLEKACFVLTCAHRRPRKRCLLRRPSDARRT